MLNRAEQEWPEGMGTEIAARETFSGVPGDSKCECADKDCAVHHGVSECRNVASTILYRIDMQDEAGTAFCDGCADDAFESGLFTDSTDEDDDDV